MHVQVAYPIPVVFAKVGRLHKFAILALHFGDATALGQPGVLVALLGDISLGPEPESMMHLYIMSILSSICNEKPTEVALRTSAA